MSSHGLCDICYRRQGLFPVIAKQARQVADSIPPSLRLIRLTPSTQAESLSWQTVTTLCEEGWCLTSVSNWRNKRPANGLPLQRT